MKRTIIFRAFLLSLVLLLSASMVVSASPNTLAIDKSLSTNFTLVNMSTTTDASVQVSYYKPDGSPWKTPADSYTIAKNFGQQIIAQYFDPNLSAGRGSVVVSSNAQLGAVVQVLARNQTPTSDAYVGVDTPADTYYVPQVLKNRNTVSGLSTTQLAIQNASGAAISALKVTFIASPGSGLSNFTSGNIAIAANASYNYDLRNEAGLPDGWYGSAVVNSETGKNVAVVVSLFAGANSLQTINAFPSTMIGTDWSIPLFTSRLANGLSTPVLIQNLSGSSMAVNSIVMTCKSTLSSPATITLKNPVAVADTASFAFNPVTDSTIAGNWTGACSLTAPGNVVVFAQMRKPGVTDDFAGYPAFLSNSTNKTVVIPLMSKRQKNGFATVATIQNLSSSAVAHVNLTYTPSADYIAGGGSATPITMSNQAIPAGGNLIQNLRFQDVPAVPDGWYGTLVVTSSDQPVVGFVQLTNYLGSAGDTFMAHDAFSLP